jgi:hypothetical protein
MDPLEQASGSDRPAQQMPKLARASENLFRFSLPQNDFFLPLHCISGKTELLKTIAAYARTRNCGPAICSATTGLASLNQPNGFTAHSNYGIPVLDKDDHTVLCSVVEPHSSRGQLLSAACLQTWDEIAAAHVSVFHAVLRLLRQLQVHVTPDVHPADVAESLLQQRLPATGTLSATSPQPGDEDLLHTNGAFVTAGDFRQTPPVVIYPDETSVYEASIRSSPVFRKYFKVFRLTRLVRQAKDPEYGNAVMEIGNGAVPPGEDGLIPLPLNKAVTDLDAVREFLFPDSILADPGAKSTSLITCLSSPSDSCVSLCFIGNAEISVLFPAVGHHIAAFSLFPCRCYTIHQWNAPSVRYYARETSTQTPSTILWRAASQRSRTASVLLLQWETSMSTKQTQLMYQTSTFRRWITPTFHPIGSSSASARSVKEHLECRSGSVLLLCLYLYESL